MQKVQRKKNYRNSMPRKTVWKWKSKNDTGLKQNIYKMKSDSGDHYVHYIITTLCLMLFNVQK